jgi:hypothetical protein
MYSSPWWWWCCFVVAALSEIEMKLFFYPEYFRAVSKKSSRWLEHKFVNNFLGTSLIKLAFP